MPCASPFAKYEPVLFYRDEQHMNHSLKSNIDIDNDVTAFKMQKHEIPVERHFHPFKFRINWKFERNWIILARDVLPNGP